VPKSKVFAPVLIALLGLGLAACQKPNPGVSVWSGTNSVHREAVCWTELDAITPEGCAQTIVESAINSPEVGTIEILSDQTVGISVDPEIAEFGWYIAIGGQRFNNLPIHETYYRFTFPKVAIPTSGYDMQVISQGKGSATRGIWVFKLINAAN
jgi:hypothetical protein